MPKYVADEVLEELEKQLRAAEEEFDSRFNRWQSLTEQIVKLIPAVLPKTYVEPTEEMRLLRLRRDEMKPLLEESRGRIAVWRDLVRAQYVARGRPLPPQLETRSIQ